MKKKQYQLFTLILLLFITSCSKESIENDFRNAFDCEFENNTNFIGICLNGSETAFKNETLTYASKATANFTEIQWEVVSGDIEIVTIDNTLDDDLPKSIATIQFNSNFNGGTIKVTAIDNNSNSIAEVSNYTIALEN